MMNALVILLIIASQGYQPLEYGIPRTILENSGYTVEVASNVPGFAYAIPSATHANVCDDSHCNAVAQRYKEYARAKIDIELTNIDVDRYAGIFIVGGPGAMEFLDNQVVYSVMQRASEQGKLIGAICISPRILAHAGLLSGKKATGWNGDHNLEKIFRRHNVTLVKKHVIHDGLCITADGPQSADEFGKAIVHALQTRQ